jgi:hypothetical protein
VIWNKQGSGRVGPAAVSRGPGNQSGGLVYDNAAAGAVLFFNASSK